MLSLEAIMEQRKILITGGSGFIGTHLVDDYLSSGVDFINIDKVKPKKEEHFKYWRNCNILDLERLKNIFMEYQPTHIVHLAAQTTTDGNSLDDYQDNTLGTANVLEAIQNTPSTVCAIIASSQHVRKPGSGFPQNDLDFNPHGFYGESKVVTEKLTRQANLSCAWSIIRPTTVWGPYHPFLPAGLWKLMSKGWYFHPKDDMVFRSYGYVKNIAWGIEKLLNIPFDTINKRVLYLGDEPIKQVEWIDSFSMALIGRNAIKIPKEWILILARIGDVLDKIGIRFPMNSPRYFNLTTTNPVPIDIMIKQFGTPPYSLDAGIAETIAWLKRSSRGLV
jgi:nucleoside-diphosphate-sugar epimerase